MDITFFSSHQYDKDFFIDANKNFGFNFHFIEEQLNQKTAVLANTEAICVFVNDIINAEVLSILSLSGVKIIALRCAGFNNVDVTEAVKLGIKIVRVPSYSPEAVAEHAVTILMTLNRKSHKAYNRVREQNFSLDGLLGFNLHHKTIGVIGTGNIGKAFCRIMLGFGCRVIAYDIHECAILKEMGVVYLAIDKLFEQSDIISLHCPLNEQTKYLINEDSIDLMKMGVALINTSRGGLVDTKAVINGLRTKKIGYLGLDVYEQEDKIFFRDLSDTIMQDDLIALLMSFPNVLITAHQGFFTVEALKQIAATTLNNIRDFKGNVRLKNEVIR